MTATTYENKGNPFGGIFLFILVVSVIAFAITILSHGNSKHGNESDDIRNCLNKNGIFQMWYNEETMREARVCQFPEVNGKGKFGIQICQQDDICFTDELFEVTSFVKDKFKIVEQIERYLTNNGYIKLW